MKARWRAGMSLAVALMIFNGLGAANGAVADSSRTELKVGYVEFPPYEYSGPSGEPAGEFLDLTRQVAEEAGYDVRFVYVPVSRAYLYLRNGNIDLWPGLTGVPALYGSVVESVVSPINVKLNAWYLDNMPSIEHYADFDGRLLILIAGYTYGGLASYLEQNPRIRVTYAPNHEAALEMLKMKRGDYLLDYRPPIEATLLHQGILESVNQSGIRSRQAAWLFSLRNHRAEQVRDDFDAAYRRLVSRGEVPPLPEPDRTRLPGLPVN